MMVRIKIKVESRAARATDFRVAPSQPVREKVFCVL